MPAMIFGIQIGPQNITLDDMREVWRFADTHGFEWVSVWDHMYESPPAGGGTLPTFEPVTLMTLMAVDTRSIRIGSLVFCMLYRNPALLVKSLMTVEHLSGGRLEIGLGAGWHEPEITAFGYDFPPVKERMDRLEEGVQVIRRLLTRERADFEGRYYRVRNAVLNPRPLQERVPIWVGGGGEQRTIRIAARHADGWNVAYASPEQFAHKNRVLDEWCEKEGRDPATIARGVNVGFYMGATEAEGQRVKERLYQQWGARAEQTAGGQLIGGPAEAIDRVGQYIDAGAQRLNIAIRPPVDWEALQAFTEEVIPRFTAAALAGD